MGDIQFIENSSILDSYGNHDSVRMFGYLILSIDFFDFISLFSTQLVLVLIDKICIKHSRKWDHSLHTGGLMVKRNGICNEAAIMDLSG